MSHQEHFFPQRMPAVFTSSRSTVIDFIVVVFCFFVFFLDLQKSSHPGPYNSWGYHRLQITSLSRKLMIDKCKSNHLYIYHLYFYSANLKSITFVATLNNSCTEK